MTYDVVIVGGGPAGAATALTLLKYTGLRCLLVDATPDKADPFKVGETVSPAFLRLLAYLGGDQAFLEDGHQPAYAAYAAWGSPMPVERHSIHSGNGHGWHLHRARFDAQLLSEAARAGGEVWRQTRLQSLAPTEQGWRIGLRQNGEDRHINAAFVVDATGRKSAVTRMLGVSWSNADKLVGVSAIFDTEQQLPGEIWVETVPMGWWYAASLPEKRLIVTLMADNDQVAAHHLHESEAWGNALCETRHIYPLLETAQLAAGLRVSPAHSRVLDQACGERWAAVGDAALSLDPLSSMGIGFALSSGIQAARGISAALSGDSTVLDAYTSDIRQQFSHYHQTLGEYYALEKRWGGHLFWERRA